MIEIRVKEMLNEMQKTKYWFVKEMAGSYQSLSKLMNNDISGIKFETLEKMCKIFNCEVGELITFKKDDEN